MSHFSVRQLPQVVYTLPFSCREATGNQGLKWRVVRELLHADDRKSYSLDEASKLCSGFSLFLVGSNVFQG